MNWWGGTTIAILQNQPFIEPGFVATDACDPAVTVTVTGNVDVTRTGQYFLDYKALDDSGNARSTRRTVLVMTPPTVEVLPPANGISGEVSLRATVDQFTPDTVVYFGPTGPGMAGRGLRPVRAGAAERSTTRERRKSTSARSSSVMPEMAAARSWSPVRADRAELFTTGAR